MAGHRVPQRPGPSAPPWGGAGGWGRRMGGTATRGRLRGAVSSAALAPPTLRATAAGTRGSALSPPGVSAAPSCRAAFRHHGDLCPPDPMSPGNADQDPEHRQRPRAAGPLPTGGCPAAEPGRELSGRSGLARAGGLGRAPVTGTPGRAFLLAGRCAGCQRAVPGLDVSAGGTRQGWFASGCRVGCGQCVGSAVRGGGSYTQPFYKVKKVEDTLA